MFSLYNRSITTATLSLLGLFTLKVIAYGIIDLPPLCPVSTHILFILSFTYVDISFQEMVKTISILVYMRTTYKW